MFLPIETERDEPSWKHVVPNKRGRGQSVIRLMNASVSQQHSEKQTTFLLWENIRPPPQTSPTPDAL